MKTQGSVNDGTASDTDVAHQPNLRWRAIGKRWLSVLFLQVVAIAGLILCVAVLDEKLAFLVGWMDRWWKWTAVGILITFVLVILGRRGLLGNWGLRKAYLNPPRWLQMVMALSAIIILVPHVQNFGPRFGSTETGTWFKQWGGFGAGVLFLFGVTTLAVIGPWLKHFVFNYVDWLEGWVRWPACWLSPKEGNTNGKTFDLTKLDFDEICQWIKTDDPVNTSQQDYFGCLRIAERMAERLKIAARGSEGNSSFALIGELGSGKSTILRLVEQQLNFAKNLDQQILIVPVSLWPYQSVEGAIQGILSAIERKFSTITSTSSIANVPTNYRKAVGKVHPGVEALIEVFGMEKTPSDALKDYEDLARLIDVHVVIWIEDMERFKPLDSPSQGVHIREPIQSLLHQLQEVQRLTVVLASNDLKTRVDLQKIVRYVERIPPIKVTTAWPVIAKFRKGCLAQLEMHGMIDPAKHEARKILSEEDPEEIRTSSIIQGNDFSLDNVVQLCRTPRVLKHALRHGLDVWEHLRGEIDFDDMLLMCILWSARPDVFALVDKHLGNLRSTREGHTPAEKNGNEAAKESFKQALDGLMDPDGKQGIEWILKFVFPKFYNETEVLEKWKPQGLVQHFPHDYWIRFLSVPRLSEKEREQPVLEAIEKWNKGQSKDLVDIVFENERKIIAQHYVDRIDANRLIALLNAVVAERVNEPMGTYIMGDETKPDPRRQGITCVYQMCKDHNLSNENRKALAKGVATAIDTAMPKNLGLVNEISRLFVFYEPQDQHSLTVLQDEDRKNLIERILKGIQSYVGKPEALVNALDGSERLTISEFVKKLSKDSKDEHQQMVPFSGWPDLAKTVLEAAQKTPVVMLPQIAQLIFEWDRHKLMRDNAVTLFGDTELAPVFSYTDEVLGKMREDDNKTVQFVRKSLSS